MPAIDACMHQIDLMLLLTIQEHFNTYVQPLGTQLWACVCYYFMNFKVGDKEMGAEVVNFVPVLSAWASWFGG